MGSYIFVIIKMYSIIIVLLKFQQNKNRYFNFFYKHQLKLFFYFLNKTKPNI